MCPGVRRVLALSDAHGDVAAVAAGDRRRLAARVHRHRPRARCLDLSRQPASQGHRAVDRQLVAVVVQRTLRRAGADSDGCGVYRAYRPVPRDPPLFRGTILTETRIEISDLTVHYGEVAAVKGVSLTIAQGEHVTLLGPSGCGKTTTLRAIAGLEEPSGGTIRIDGTAVYSAAERRNVPAEKRGVSMVFQSYAVWPHMSVFDNVAYGLRVRKLPGDE